MLEYNRIDVSRGIDVHKRNLSRECDFCQYWYFKDIGFKYEKYLCNGCYDLMQKAMSFDNVAIFYVKGNACRIHFWYLSNSFGNSFLVFDAINIINGSNVDDKRDVLCFF